MTTIFLHLIFQIHQRAHHVAPYMNKRDVSGLVAQTRVICFYVLGQRVRPLLAAHTMGKSPHSKCVLFLKGEKWEFQSHVHSNLASKLSGSKKETTTFSVQS